MKYNKGATITHSISQNHKSCIKDYNVIVLDEDDSINTLPTLFIDTVALDLDCVEIHRAKAANRNRVRTMDSTFAVSDNTNTEMLLVELRFNYTNLKKLDRTVLIEKVAGSQSILGNTIPINSKYLLIFKPHLVQQATNRLQRMNPRIPNNYVAMDIPKLIETYF